jgi:predicted RecB family nuclease
VAFLTKSRFTTGWQCEKLLWWSVHEPEAKELAPDTVLRDLFDQGRHVGELARLSFPRGTLIDSRHSKDDRLSETQAALAFHASAIFEGCFSAGGVFVAVDILLRQGPHWTLIEVKSASEVKAEHIPDVALQVWVLRRAGVDVNRVQIMHLNKAYRHPGPEPLFERTDVTEDAEEFLPRVYPLIQELQSSLEKDLPDKPLGMHCHEPRECAFHGRCWPQDPLHIRHLYNVGPRKTVSYLAAGVHSIRDLDPAAKLPPAARRQLRAIEENRIIVEPTLAKALEPFESPLGFLDFETVYRAVPVWDGLAPWGQATAQFSYHEERHDGSHSHVGWLAEGPGDPRRELAVAMLEATAKAKRIVTYSCFEKTRIRELQALVPDLAEELEELLGKLVDLHPVVRDHVYHPGFQGSFSLKYVLQPMVPELSYHDLVIVDGRTASVEIARLLFVAHKIAPAERERLRQDLLDYCERDTWATVRLLQSLRKLAS